MGYQVFLTAEAQNSLSRLDQPIRDRLLKRLKLFIDNFDSLQHESLSGEFANYFKYRIGEYRVIYTFSKSEKTILIKMLGHRRDIYKIK
jgi:mRNA interferase RelE/StbE